MCISLLFTFLLKASTSQASNQDGRSPKEQQQSNTKENCRDEAINSASVKRCRGTKHIRPTTEWKQKRAVFVEETTHEAKVAGGAVGAGFLPAGGCPAFSSGALLEIWRTIVSKLASRNQKEKRTSTRSSAYRLGFILVGGVTSLQEVTPTHTHPHTRTLSCENELLAWQQCIWVRAFSIRLTACAAGLL